MPSSTGDAALDRTLSEFADQINLLPGMSIISTSDGPESSYSGNSGDLVFDVGSSATTYWGKTSGDDSMVGWSAFQLGDDAVVAVTEVKGGSVSVANVSTTVVTHGMTGTPNSVVITPKNQEASDHEDTQTAGRTPFVSVIDSTTFTINWDGIVPSGAASDWYWIAVVNA